MQHGMHLALPPHGYRLTSRLCLILAWLALPAAAARADAATSAGDTTLAAASDLAGDARLLRQRRVPLLVLYTRDDCSWCERLRREYLGPLQRDPAAPVLIRQIHIDRDQPLTDWNGKSTTQREFARSQGIGLVPTVALLGPGGEALAEPIVGLASADFYGGLLERAIGEAKAKLAETAPR